MTAPLAAVLAILLLAIVLQDAFEVMLLPRRRSRAGCRSGCAPGCSATDPSGP